jgi:hypothetical protein
MSLYEDYYYNLIDKVKDIEERPIQSISLFISEVRLQRLNHPDFPFYYKDIPIDNLKSSLSWMELVSIVKNENFEYLNTQYINELLYEDRQIIGNEGLVNQDNIIDEYYLYGDNDGEYVSIYNSNTTFFTNKNIKVWCFCDNTSISLSNRRYIYLPVSERISSHLSSIPKYKEWNISSGYIGYKEPNDPFLIIGRVEQWYNWYSLVGSAKSHPFNKHLEFTNRVTEQGYDKELLYEYIDNKGLLGRVGSRYLSIYKPIDLSGPIGLARTLIKDPCYDQYIGGIPSKGYYPYDIGEFTGYITQEDYLDKPCFLYKKGINSCFLSFSPPSNYIDFPLETGIYIQEQYCKEKVYIPDPSSRCSWELVIQDFTCSPSLDNQDLIDQCLILGNNSYINNQISGLMNDITYIVDEFFYFSCVRDLLNLQDTLYSDTTLINNSYYINTKR